MFLDHQQMTVLTGRTRYSAQVRALRAMGIDFLRRPDGRPLVLIEKLVNRVPHSDRPNQETHQPDWSQINVTTAKTQR